MLQVMSRQSVLAMSRLHRDNAGKRAFSNVVWKTNDSVLGAVNKDALAFAGARRVVVVDVEGLLGVVKDSI